MEEEINKLKKEVKDLESELSAALRREELLLNPLGKTSGLKQKIKKTRIGRLAADPNSKLGKVVRSPRTIFRIATHPGILKEMKAEKKKGQKTEKSTDSEAASLFVPIEFFMSEYSEPRVNLVMEKMEPELLKMAVEFANGKGAELRVVTYGEKADPVKYKKMVDSKKVPKAKKISFYSSVDQKSKNKVFQLEIGENDIFITKAWSNNGK